MPETNQKEFEGVVLISENKDYSEYSPGDATHPLQPIAVSPSTENISNSLGKAARWIEVIDEKTDKAGNLSASSGINIYGDGSTGNPKKITNTGVNSVENTTNADTSATNGDIRIVNKTVNPSTGVVSDSVSYVKPKGINDPAFKALDSSTSGLTSDDEHVPTSKTVQDAIDTALASASVYKGTISAFNDLPTSTSTVIVRKGWYYRVSTAWAAATGTPATHVGDIIIAEIDSPSKAIDSTNWSLLHNEANTDASVAQSPVSTNANYEVLFSGSADNTAHTEGTGKDSGLTYNPSTNKLTISGEVSATSYSGLPEGNTTTKGIVQLGTDADKAASGTHGHGNITNGGALQTTDVSIASGDKLVITDASDSNKVARSSVSFDGSTDTQALTKKGTFESFQTPITNSNKLSSDLVDDTNKTHRFATAAQLTQIATNQTNILYGIKYGGGRNLLEFNLDLLKTINTLGSWSGNVYTYNGVTYTINSDNTVTVSAGSTHAYSYLKFCDQNYDMGNRKRFLDNSPLYLTGGISADVYMSVYAYTATGGGSINNTSDTDTAVTFTNTEKNYNVSLGVVENKSASATIKPMLRSQTITDRTYQPYARPNSDLTALEAEDRAALAEQVDEGAKNKFNFDAWKSVGIKRGSKSVNANSITLTASSQDCYTYFAAYEANNESFPEEAFMFFPVGETIVFSWNYVPNSGQTNDQCRILAYNNSTFVAEAYALSSTGRIEFTVPATANIITLRVGVFTSGNSATYSNIMVTTKSKYDISPTYEPYALGNQYLTPALIEQVDEGAKNVFDLYHDPNRYPNPTATGLTAAILPDGTVLVTGTPTSAEYTTLRLIDMPASYFRKFNGYYLSGSVAPSGTVTKTQMMFELASSPYTKYGKSEDGNPDETPLNFPDSSSLVYFFIRIYNADTTTPVNLTFKPMMTTKAKLDISQNYAPYALPNSELTKEVNILRTSMDNLFRTPVFGFRINKNESDSPTAVEYLYDAVGMTPAYMDFTNSTFNYGSWSDAWFVKNNKPVALNFDGTEAFELDPTNYWLKSDGTTDSGIEDESTTYNFMARFPLVYINRWEDENYNYVAISERPVTPNFLAQAHTGLNGTINSNIYLPMFKGWIDGSTGGTISSTGKFRSLAGKWPSCGTDATEEFNAIKNITGSATSGWQLFAHSQYCLLNDLLTLISKSIDVKACFGRGDVSTYSASDSTVRDGSKTGYANNGKYISGYEGYAAGTTTKSTCGQFFGYDDATHHVTAFFVQDPWGNRWDRSPGLNRINRAYKVKMTPPYSMNSDSSYITAGIQTPSSEGWLRKISSSNTYGHLPFAVGDGAADTKNKYFWSYFYTNANTDEKLSLVGGHCGNGGKCSSRFVSLNSASSLRTWYFGGSPCYVSP